MTDKPVYSPEQMAREVESLALAFERQAVSNHDGTVEVYTRKAEILRAAAKLLRGEPQIGSEP